MFSTSSVNLRDSREISNVIDRRNPGRIIQSVSLTVVILLLAAANGWTAAPSSKAEAAPIRTVELNEPGGQILSFRHLSGGTVVHMKGTRIEPMASAKMKIGSRRGFVEIDFNRGDIKALQPARRFGNDFLTYVLWAVSIDGNATNLGEITFQNNKPVSINVTTPYQTFWLMITAEPDYAVSEPSSVVVLYSLSQEGLKIDEDKKALPVPGKLFYYTHYADYDTSPATVVLNMPNEVLQAKKAIELAAKSGVLARETSEGQEPLVEEARIHETLKRAKYYMTQANGALSSPEGTADAVQFGRTAAQIAENARALSLGSVGGINILLLEREIENMEADVAAMEDQVREAEANLEKQLEASGQADERAKAAEQKLADAYAQAEAARERTQDVREQLAVLQGAYDNSMQAARLRIGQLRSEREQICGELRRQLGSLGQLTQQGSDMVLTLASDVLFDSGSYELRPAARESLAKVAILRMLLFPDTNVRYEGHTDRVGGDAINQWLSEQRALAVYDYFLSEKVSHETDPEAHAAATQRVATVRTLLGMKYTTQQGPSPARQSMMAKLSGSVVGRGEMQPAENVDGPSERNRRVTLLFPPAEVGRFSSRCEERKDHEDLLSLQRTPADL